MPRYHSKARLSKAARSVQAQATRHDREASRQAVADSFARMVEAERAEAKPRIPANLVAAAQFLTRVRPALASRIERAVMLAVQPQNIKPEYCATPLSCRCADARYRGHNSRGCKHSIALWLRREAGMNAA